MWPFCYFSRSAHRRAIIQQLRLLNMNLTDLTSAVDGVSASIDAAVAKLGSPGDQPAIDALTAKLNDAKAKLDAAIPTTP